MTNINLLPWREAQRRIQNRRIMMVCLGILVLAGLMVMLTKLHLDTQIQYQQDRNAYVQSEIDALSKIIEEVENLKDKRDQLLARMEVIQTLQASRSQIVHVFDDLVTKLPKGVYYDTIQKSDGNLRIEGKALSNGRISALMRNLDSSDWFRNTSLKVVDVIDQNSTLVSKFNLEVKEEKSVTVNRIENIQ